MQSRSTTPDSSGITGEWTGLLKMSANGSKVVADLIGKTKPDELAKLYVEKGLDPLLAEEVARQIHVDVDNAVSVHAREELGVDPDDLASPMVAAVSSFLAFAVGALVPVLPYLLGAGSLAPTLVVTLLALFACGAVVTQVTSRAWWYGGTRQMVLGAAAAALTYLFGSLVGSAGIG